MLSVGDDRDPARAGCVENDAGDAREILPRAARRATATQFVPLNEVTSFFATFVSVLV